MRYKYKFDVDFRLYLTENNLETHINTYIYNWVYPTAVPGLSTSDNLIFVKHLNGQNVRQNCSNKVVNSSKTIRYFFQMLVIGKSWHSLLTVYVLNGFPSLTIVGDDGG